MENRRMKTPREVLIVVLVLLSGCTTNVVVEGSVPTPLVTKIPANVAVYYDDGFKSFIHTEDLKEEGTWKIDLSRQNLTFFRNLTNALFDSVVEVDSPELTPAQQATLDGIFIPKIEKYGFLTPNISGLKFFSASIHYRITILDRNNETVADYIVVGYGKSQGGAFDNSKALGKAKMLAIRDGGTRIATELREQPAIIAWLSEEVK